MPLLKDDKKKLAKEYVQRISSAVNVALISHNALSVNDLNALRMDVEEKQGTLEFVKKRVLLKWVNNEALTEDMLKGSIAVLYSNNADDAYAPMKALQAHMKQWKKAKLPYEVEYVAGFFDGEWKDGKYTTELADLPSKEELIGKLLFLMQYPVSSFARAVKAIGEKKAE
jgi:large subunit ribosomal protein L10